MLRGREKSVHTVAVIVVGISPKKLRLAPYAILCRHEIYRRMLNAIEHVRLNVGVMIHVLERETRAGFQRLLKAPGAYEVATQTTVAPETVFVSTAHSITQCLCDARLVRHFQTVGHVAGKRGINNSGTYPAVLHNIEHRDLQVARPPCESAPRLHDDMQVWMTLFESLQHLDQMVTVVVGTRHQMSPAHIEPFQLRQPLGELFLESYKHLFQVIA